MSDRFCITCGARYMTAHATNCPMHLANKDAIISEQQARIDELNAENKALVEDRASLLYELWSLCESAGVEWTGPVPPDPEASDEH